CQQYNNWNRF
nr:immunoglobulin light chain junction region [Macaca mulatta]MOV63309.1 immunoglobulin light chain junction region [Macaca mulatta]MOV64799.1 immunoglobulin light chain junction region [Macaca mulatta]MOV64943.1 immunoglobulin light chain junction region [Macaca mulatta]